MVDRTRFLRVDPEDLRVAKGIASFKGKSLKLYFRELVDEEARKFQMEMKSDMPAYRRRKQ